MQVEEPSFGVKFYSPSLSEVCIRIYAPINQLREENAIRVPIHGFHIQNFHDISP